MAAPPSVVLMSPLNRMKALPDEFVGRILKPAICAPQVLPSEEDDFLESLKATADDCERAAQYLAYQETRALLRQVCPRWERIIDTLYCDTWVILTEVGDPPLASRVQLPAGNGCECGQPDCPVGQPPSLGSYDLAAEGRPLKAFIESSNAPDRNVMQLIRKHPTLRVLATSVDLRDAESNFSLWKFSRVARDLTHLSLSEFNMPAGTRSQVLDLPQLHTLSLSFYCPMDSIPPPGLTRAINHHSWNDWKLPRLHNLALRGGVWESDTNFIHDIHTLIRGVGTTLQGLLYNPWIFTSRGDSPYPIPNDLWSWCPRLQSIQVSLPVLFSGPKPPPGHPRLTILPAHIANLDTLPEIGHILWPPGFIQEFPSLVGWPIERFQISTGWYTFYRKLSRLDLTGASGALNDPNYWPMYFARLGDCFRRNGFQVEDRYGGRLIDGVCPELFSWFSKFRQRLSISSVGSSVNSGGDPESGEERASPTYDDEEMGWTES